MTQDVCTIWFRHNGVTHAVRWHAAHPQGVYAVLEGWLREGVIDICEFNICLGCICQAANVATEATK